MKQYTTPEQTAKLIELGLPKPKAIIDVWAHETEIDMVYEYEYAYSIGELIELLPENVAKENEMPSTLNISLMNSEWCVQYADFLGTDFEFCNTKLVDALYYMVVTLKEKGVI